MTPSPQINTKRLAVSNNQKIKQPLWVIAAIIGLLAVSGCSADAGAEDNSQGLDEITIAHDSTADAAAVGLGLEQGFFEEEGINVEYTTVGAPPATVAAVQSGEVDVGSVPTLPTITALEQGVGVLPFMSGSGFPRDDDDLEQYDQLTIYVAPDSEITRPAELEGSDVAVPAREAVMEILISDAVSNDGGDPSKVNWIVLDYGSQVSALADGRVEAAGLSLPFTVQAEEAGAEMLMGPSIDFYEEGPLTNWIASPHVADDEDLRLRLQRAIQKSNNYANEHPDEAMAKAAEITGISQESFESARGFNYYPIDFKAEDLERANQKMHELGFLNEPADLEGLYLPADPLETSEVE